MSVFGLKDNYGPIPDLTINSLHEALTHAKNRAKAWHRTIVVVDSQGGAWVVFPDQKVVKRKAS